VHGEHALQRKQEIEHREDGLLDLPAVGGAAMMASRCEKLMMMKVSVRVPSIDGGGLERGRADHGELGAHGA